jgi:hypothetical protein
MESIRQRVRRSLSEGDFLTSRGDGMYGLSGLIRLSSSYFSIIVN